MKTYYSHFSSPLGPLLLTSDGSALTRLSLPINGSAAEHRVDWTRDDSAVSEPIAQLSQYFAGALKNFQLALRPAGTEFQRAVWAGLCDIPFGTTISYAELARRIGRAKACRAVGAANGRNPIAIIIPCHRVIGADGTLTGYGGGLPIKEWLLKHEKSAAGPSIALVNGHHRPVHEVPDRASRVAAVVG